MLFRKLKAKNSGFTLVEVLVIIFLIGIISATAYQAFAVSLREYFGLHENTLKSGELALNSQRVATVLRGATDIVAVDANDLTVYAYFSPEDTYVSLVHYYLNAQNTQLLVDITPMTANPPTGVPIEEEQRSYTIIENYFKKPGLDLFAYLDASGSDLNLPIADLNSIKGIRVNLAVPIDYPTEGSSQQLSLEVNLRNRKTNL